MIFLINLHKNRISLVKLIKNNNNRNCFNNKRNKKKNKNKDKKIKNKKVKIVKKMNK